MPPIHSRLQGTKRDSNLHDEKLEKVLTYTCCMNHCCRKFSLQDVRDIKTRLLFDRTMNEVHIAIRDYIITALDISQKMIRWVLQGQTICRKAFCKLIGISDFLLCKICKGIRNNKPAPTPTSRNIKPSDALKLLVSFLKNFETYYTLPSPSNDKKLCPTYITTNVDLYNCTHLWPWFCSTRKNKILWTLGSGNINAHCWYHWTFTMCHLYTIYFRYFLSSNRSCKWQTEYRIANKITTEKKWIWRTH